MSPAALHLPFTLGQYQVLARIGKGGMGVVYRGLHTRLKKAVAIKILPAECTPDARAVARFQREMEAIGRLDHPNIVRATDAGDAAGVHYLVMELIDGIDLSRLVRRHGPLAVAPACDLVRQAAAGLHCAHEHGLVHRDVKPSNLMLSVKGEVKILDLGLALLNRTGPASGELTASGQFMGTADYMAPEQWEASHAVDIRADLYSLGCTLYTLLVGRPPFGGPGYDSALRKMAAHARDLAEPVTNYRRDVPAPVLHLLQQLMAKEPADRPATPAEVARALEPFCAGAALAVLVHQVQALPHDKAPLHQDQQTGEGEATPVSRPVRSAPPVSRVPRRSVLLATGLGVLAAVVVLVVLLRPWLWVGDDSAVEEQPVAKSAPAPAPPVNRRGWQDLLTSQPTKRLWVSNLDSRLDHDPKTEILWITSAKTALIRLGETQAKAYKLQLGIRQLRWPGGVGVYFGGQKGHVSDTFEFQMIVLRQTDPGSQQPFRLMRFLGTARMARGNDPQVATENFASERLSRPLDNSEQLLELQITREGLASVRWNGDPCRNLITEQATRWATAHATDRGEFGIYCSASTVAVSTARLQITE
jgi:serine/threonine protein kinase